MDSGTRNIDMTKGMISVKATAKPGTVANDSAQITIKEFLNFVKTAYQVQDSVEGILMAGGMTEAISWLKSKENETVLKQIAQKERNSSCQTSETNVKQGSEDKKDVSRRRSSTLNDTDPLKIKLNEVLSEGLLDSVLPYLIQGSSTVKKTSYIKLPVSEKSHHYNVSQQSSDGKIVRRKSTDASLNKPITKADSEVEIHVCDEIKNMKKTFVCNQQLLVEKMGYFADVTVGQKLEDMDISVHCDIGIFEWLMQWVKKDSLLEEDWPQLDPQCVIPILVSAAFLQMEPLLNDCLLFCHQHMNEILRTATNLSCLNDSVLTRLAAMYTNVELESIRDRKDKIQSRLFSKLIISLAEPEAESVRGHWNSLARIFRCEKCQQLISPYVATRIPCIPPCMRLQWDGSIISLHVRDTTWNINDYILRLHKNLKTWRRVYWRLWGDAHFLFCLTCKRYFPVHQIAWCRYHPDPPQFFTLDAQKAPLPVGRYPCCGERAYRFQLLQNYSGCQFRQHMVCTKDVKESAIFTILESYRHLIEEEPPQLLFPERLTRLVQRDPSTNDKSFASKETFWWEGFQIIPPRPKLGMLSYYSNRMPSSQNFETQLPQESTDEASEEESSSSSSSLSDGSGESNPVPAKKIESSKRRKHKKSTGNKLWQHNLSARSNQDIQRAFEESAIKEMTVLLNRKTCSLGDTSARSNKSYSRNITPMGGVWVRLEAEWKESVCQTSNAQSKLRNIFTGKINKGRGKFTFPH